MTKRQKTTLGFLGATLLVMATIVVVIKVLNSPAEGTITPPPNPISSSQAGG